MTSHAPIKPLGWKRPLWSQQSLLKDYRPRIGDNPTFADSAEKSEKQPALTIASPATTNEGAKRIDESGLILPGGIKSWQSIVESDAQELGFIVDGLVEEGGISLFVARQKEGKSMLAGQMVIDVANGEKFLGRLGTRMGSVLYLDFENRLHRLRARGIDLAQGRRLDNIYIAAYDRISDRNLGLDGGHFGSLCRIVSEIKPCLLVIDPLRLATDSDLTDPKKVVALLTTVSRLQSASPKTGILLVHHLVKSNHDNQVKLRDDPRTWIDRVYGSQALIAHVETIIGLERDTDGLYTLATVPRSSEPLVWQLEKIPQSERFILAANDAQVRTWSLKQQEHWNRLPREFSWGEGVELVGNSTLDRIVRKAMPAGLLAKDEMTKRYRKADGC